MTQRSDRRARAEFRAAEAQARHYDLQRERLNSLPFFDSVDVWFAEGTDEPVRVTGAAARRIDELWHSLEPTYKVYEHMPAYTLNFRVGEIPVAYASICWLFHSILLTVRDTELMIEVNGRTAESLALLDELKRISPPPPNALLAMPPLNPS